MVGRNSPIAYRAVYPRTQLCKAVFSKSFEDLAQSRRNTQTGYCALRLCHLTFSNEHTGENAT
jgi:hypothetical protein